MGTLGGVSRPIHTGALLNWRTHLIWRMLEGVFPEAYDQVAWGLGLKHLDPTFYAIQVARAVGIWAYLADHCGVAKDVRLKQFDPNVKTECDGVFGLLFSDLDYFPPTWLGPDPRMVAIRELHKQLDQAAHTVQSVADELFDVLQTDPDCKTEECQSLQQKQKEKLKEMFSIQNKLVDVATRKRLDCVSACIEKGGTEKQCRASCEKKAKPVRTGPLQYPGAGKVGFSPHGGIATSWIEGIKPPREGEDKRSGPGQIPRRRWQALKDVYLELRLRIADGEVLSGKDKEYYNMLVCGLTPSLMDVTCKKLMKDHPLLDESEGEK